MELTAEQQVAADLAEIYELHEKPHAEWLPVLPGPTLVAGYRVLPHVQAFADVVRLVTGVQSIGTYPGHSPSIDRALDLFTPVNSRTLGDAICDYFMANLARFGGRYAIYRQRIWHRLDPVWRPMEDRGSITQNHFDHVHLSFETTAAEPEPPTKPEPEEEVTMFIGDGPAERGGGVWQSNGVFRKRVRTGDTWAQLGDDGAKVARHIGVFETGTFDDLIDIEEVIERLDNAGQAGGVDLSAIADRVAAKVADLIGKRLES